MCICISNSLELIPTVLGSFVTFFAEMNRKDEECNQSFHICARFDVVNVLDEGQEEDTQGVQCVFVEVTLTVGSENVRKDSNWDWDELMIYRVLRELNFF